MDIALADIPRGLKGVVVAETEVGDVRGAEGFFHYRAHSAIDLARSRTLEDVCQLMIDGALPATEDDRRRFRDEVRHLVALPREVASILPALARRGEPMQGLRTALSHLAAATGMRPVLDLEPGQRRRDALVLCTATPTILAALWRVRSGRDPIPPDPELGWAENYLAMLTGEQPPVEHVRAIEQYLITTVDHGFNASTFTARVVASTGADVGSAIVAALGSLSGPLHGGAPSRALALLEEVGGPAVLDSPDPVGAVDAAVGPKIRRGEKVMGFGHAVYRGEDPRSLLLRDIARSLGGPTVAVAELVERRVTELLARHKPGRELRTNVEFYAGVVMERCGIPPQMFTPTFASSRVIGWSANVLEQAADGAIIRPSARYVGPAAPQPVPPLRG